MRMGKLLAAATVVAGSLAWLSRGTDPAQAAASEWDGTWFLLKTRDKGYGSENGRWKRERDKSTIYLQLETFEEGEPTPADDAFVARIWASSEQGGYDTVPLRLHVMRSGDDTDDFLVFASPDIAGNVEAGDGLRVSMVARITGKRRSDGTLKSARFKGLGGTYVEREGDRSWAGAQSVGGKAIDPSKLPF